MHEADAAQEVEAQAMIDYSEANIAPPGERATVYAGVVYPRDDEPPSDGAEGTAAVRDVREATEVSG